MLAAALAWDALAVDLTSTATSFDEVTPGLLGGLPLPGESRNGHEGNTTQDGIAPLRVLSSLIG